MLTKNALTGAPDGLGEPLVYPRVLANISKDSRIAGQAARFNHESFFV
jgi:hypothetical protein